MDWQPIETAPKDEWVLTFWWSDFETNHFCEVARLDTEYFARPTWVQQGELEPINCHSYEPTHWQPLPSPPESEKE